ncbi:hypothetical protein H8E88_21425 [candidate division KSB1 bacterium]|nr:hypothetical protein [candidate division KSB1 bacterium]MBL7094090.1 hypothetical protein [candidate division KSB1 bacterium]
MFSGKKWMVSDSYGNSIYLTQERWEHIVEKSNHPEMLEYEQQLKETISKGQRKQDSLNPQKFLYYKNFKNLFEDNNQIVVFVLFRYKKDSKGYIISNNYILTAYQKEIR